MRSELFVNADFSATAEVDTQPGNWEPSPVNGIERIYLDRIGGEVARATSLVKYGPDSRFPQHAHELGEEFLVLEGTFSDEFGDYPRGTYVRNPPGSKHAPGSKEGCVILVKLRQMPTSETGRVVLDTDQMPWQRSNDRALTIKALFSAPWETVRIEKWTSTKRTIRSYSGGAELFVLSGELEDQSGTHKSGSWLRLPARSCHEIRVHHEVVMWVKLGHLSSST